MLSEHVTLVDIDPEHWMNLVKLSQGGFSEKKPRRDKRPRVSLRLVVEAGRVIKAGHSEQGLLENFESNALADAAELARQNNVDAASIYERGTARRIMHAVQSKLTLDMNMVEQVFLVLEEIRNEFGQGIKTHPRPKLPKMKYAPIHGIVKGLLPANELIVIVVWDDTGKIRDSSGLPIVTSGIIRLSGKGELDLITTTDSLVPAGLDVAVWGRDFPIVNGLAEKVWKSKVFTAVHLPLSSLEELAREAAPDRQGPKALLTMRKAGKIVIDPLPLRFRAMLQMGGMFPGKKK